MVDLSLVLPVLNEEKIITKVVNDLRLVLKRLGITYEIILVENESTDTTWAVIRSLATKFLQVKAIRTNRGYGSAITKGINISTGKYLCYMPSDGQIDLNILPKLWKKMLEGDYQTVKIKRTNRESSLRFLRSMIFNLLARSLYPIKVGDINGSPRLLLRKNLLDLELKSKDSFIDTEFAVKARILEWKILELPMRNLERLGGYSTVRISTVFEFLKNLVGFKNDPLFKSWLEKHKRQSR